MVFGYGAKARCQHVLHVKTRIGRQNNFLMVITQRGNVRRCGNERGRCNLRFAVRTSGAINARTEGDTACEEEEHRVGGGVKGRMGDARSLRETGSAAPLAAGAGRRSG